MNPKQKKYLIYGGVAVGVGIAGFLAYKYLIKPKIAFQPNINVAGAGTNNNIGAGAPAGGGSYTPQAPASSFPLRNGSNGAMVKALQTALLTIYGDKALGGTTADGGFGGKTLAAVQNYLGLASGEVSETNFNYIIRASKSSTDKLEMQDNLNNNLPTAQTGVGGFISSAVASAVTYLNNINPFNK